MNKIQATYWTREYSTSVTYCGTALRRWRFIVAISHIVRLRYSRFWLRNAPSENTTTVRPTGRDKTEISPPAKTKLPVSISYNLVVICENAPSQCVVDLLNLLQVLKNCELRVFTVGFDQRKQIFDFINYLQDLTDCVFAVFFGRRGVNLYFFLNLPLLHSPPGSPHPEHITSSQSSPSFSPSVTPSTFHSRLKTHLFHKSFPP